MLSKHSDIMFWLHDVKLGEELIRFIFKNVIGYDKTPHRQF